LGCSNDLDKARIFKSKGTRRYCIDSCPMFWIRARNQYYRNGYSWL